MDRVGEFLQTKLNRLLAMSCVLLCLSIAAPGVAHAQAPLACWTFEFVPGERVYKDGKGNIQRGRIFYTDEFTVNNSHPMKLAEAFEQYVRRTTTPLSSKSQHVAGCTMSDAYNSAGYNARTGHDRTLNEGSGNSSRVDWTPSEPDRTAARITDNELPTIYTQCLIATDLSQAGDYYDRTYEVARTRVFIAKGNRNTEHPFRMWGRANGIKDNDVRCFSALTPERLKSEYADAMDHYGPASQAREIEFLPELAELPRATLKAATLPKRKMAPVKDALLTDVPEKDANSGVRAPSSPKYVEFSGPDGIIRLSPEVAARNQAAAEKHRRDVEAHAQAKLDAQAEQVKQLALHQLNVDAAASAKAEFDRKVAERAAAYKLALAEHAQKVAGASTDDDPKRCITSPATKPGLRGNTEVHVTNGCDQKVDIVLCLKRTTGDWLCGAQFGILSQRSMTFMSTNATGEIYVDAVTFGSKNKLGRPAGIIK